MFVVGDTTGLKAFDQRCRLSQRDAYSFARQRVNVPGCVSDEENAGAESPR